MSTFWDKQAVQYDEGLQKHDGLYNQTIRDTQALLNADDVVLDFGCASGEYSLDLAQDVQHLHGIDISAKMIELAQTKARVRQVDNISFQQTDIFDASLKQGSFSAIIAFNIFHLVEDAAQTLDHLHDLLKPGGLIISQTPCLAEQGWLLRGVIKLAHHAGLAPAVRSFKPVELEILIAGSQFEIVESKVWDKQDAVQWIVARKI